MNFIMEYNILNSHVIYKFVEFKNFIVTYDQDMKTYRREEWDLDYYVMW